ncbi:nucleoside-diphosphate-sugar epimerase GsfE [Penicillium daleae]|uniref:Nucleoside-diphosphate-sugar epimerase GsfE n=1 Tax=Penicillium daleae TaxID=63821 RepID=A0AAD6C372_9EURO|nr:nucleoside-diphosphate-sugar epimerase GsfE [Penicillium daleae]KAJ5449417.1 nucleoside-diphosphate-sugar epimerase GsfE [Penicillium daleae]
MLSVRQVYLGSHRKEDLLANGISEAFTIAVYFLLCRELGEPPLFPGNENIWTSFYQKSYAPGIADLAIFAATHEHCANEAFNHNNGDRTFWPKIAAYWGREVSIRSGNIPSPEPKFENMKKDSNSLVLGLDLIEWLKDKQEVWDRIVEKYGGKREAFIWASWDHLNWAMGRAVTTLLSLDKARKFGWTRYDSTYESWVSAFKTMQVAGILPNRRHLDSKE